jgi:hypothetical protein
MLPDTNRTADRFARASFYINAIPKEEDPQMALASVFSVIRNVSVPYGITTPDQPNISSTRWRTVADQKRLVYFFESAVTPNTFWVNFQDIDFSAETGKVMKLDLGKNQSNVQAGNAAKEFKASGPSRFVDFLISSPRTAPGSSTNSLCGSSATSVLIPSVSARVLKKNAPELPGRFEFP